MFRLCVVGSGGVGKSSLTIRYLKNEFTEYYDPTLEETYRKEIEYNGRLYEVEIVDTAGQEEYSSFRDSSVATGDAFLVLFAINSVSSWHELKDLRSKIIQDRQLTSAIPMVLVGNKLDLEEEREVNKDEVLEYCNSTDVNIPLIETSAKTGLNVEESFQLMMQQIQRIQPSLFERAAPKSQGNKAPKKPDCLLV
ncbi:ras-like protein rasD [Acropora muricata]|uniref:ras-like protein rasD n=1 Tax=Acropora millepora TaxID=45264 RepID=UPI0010FCD406|nr:ras-like protein rasD [Acropora millepora]XP_029195871.1 ras-like protein rasD [Acropora millepora]